MPRFVHRVPRVVRVAPRRELRKQRQAEVPGVSRLVHGGDEPPQLTLSLGPVAVDDKEQAAMRLQDVLVGGEVALAGVGEARSHVPAQPVVVGLAW